MNISELSKKLKQKDKNYIVTADQWYNSFTIHYKGVDIIHAYFETLANRYGWVIKCDVKFMQDQLPLILEPLNLLKDLDEPLCTDKMPLIGGFDGEREVK